MLFLLPLLLPSTPARLFLGLLQLLLQHCFLLLILLLVLLLQLLFQLFLLLLLVSHLQLFLLLLLLLLPPTPVPPPPPCPCPCPFAFLTLAGFINQLTEFSGLMRVSPFSGHAEAASSPLRTHLVAHSCTPPVPLPSFLLFSLSLSLRL